MVVAHRLAPVLAVGVVGVHVRAPSGPGGTARRARRRPRTASGASERSSVRIGPPSSWNTPMVSPRRSSSNVFGVVERRRGRCRGATPVARSTRSSVISMTSRLRSPRKSILRRPRSSTPCISYCVTIGASSSGAPGSGLRWIGQVLGERLAGDHDRGGVDAVLAAQPFEAAGDVDDALGVGVGVVELAELGRPSCSRRRTSACGSRHACSGVSRPMTSGGISLAILSPTAYG